MTLDFKQRYSKKKNYPLVNEKKRKCFLALNKNILSNQIMKKA